MAFPSAKTTRSENILSLHARLKALDILNVTNLIRLNITITLLGVVNPPKLETKQDKPYSHTFKCLNCKDKHQTDFNIYPF